MKHAPKSAGHVLWLILPLALLFLPSLSWAAETPTGVDALVGLYRAFKQPIVEFGKSMSGGGLVLIWSLVVLHIFVGGFMLAAGTTDLFDLAVQGMKLSFVAFMASSMFVSSNAMQYLSGYPTVAQAIEAGFLTLMGKAAKAAGLDLGPGAASTMMESMVRVVLEPVFRMADVKIWPDNFQWSDLLKLPGIIVGLIMWLFATLAFLAAVAVILGEVFSADLLVTFAFAFAPVLVPWLLFRPMQWLFEGWLKAMLLGSLAFLIGLLFAGGMASFASAASTLLANYAASSGVDWFGGKLVAIFSPILLGSLIIIVICGKTASFAYSLLGGGGIQGISVHAFRQAASMASKTAQVATSAPGSTYRDAAKGYQAAKVRVEGFRQRLRAMGRDDSGRGAGQEGGAAANATAAQNFSNRGNP
jgi:hypothetical protein